MSYWLHTLIGLGLIAAAVCMLRQARDMNRLRRINADRVDSETANERAARRTC